MASIIDKITDDLRNTIINSPLLLKQYRAAATSNNVSDIINSPLLLKNYRNAIQDITDLKKLIDYYNNVLSKGQTDPQTQQEMVQFLNRTNTTYVSMLKQLNTELNKENNLPDVYAKLSQDHKRLLGDIRKDLNDSTKYPGLNDLLGKLRTMDNSLQGGKF